MLVPALRIVAIVFMVFMVAAAPHGQVLAQRTVPTYAMLIDRVHHFHFSGQVFCDIGKSIGMCGNSGDLTQLHR